MTALVHSRWIGLRTLRSSWVTPALLVLMVVLFTWGALTNVGDKDLSSSAQIRDSLMSSIGFLTAVTLAVFAATRVAGEYRHDTITQRVLASPNRARMLTAELVSYAMLGLVVMGTTLAAGVIVGEISISGKHLSLGLSAGVIAGALLAGVLFALLGALAGVILRGQPAAIVAVIGVFFAEQLFAGLIKDVGHYLPYQLLHPLFGLQDAAISRGAAALCLTGITAVLTVVAYVLLDRRDVT